MNRALLIVGTFVTVTISFTWSHYKAQRHHYGETLSQREPGTETPLSPSNGIFGI